MTVTDFPTKPPADDPKDPKRRRLSGMPTWLVTAIAAISMLLAGGAFLAVFLTGRNAQDHAENVAADTAPAVLTLDVLCKRNDQLGNDLRNAGACGEKVDKAKQAVAGEPQPAVAGSSLSRDDVTAIVNAQLAGKTVTVDQVTALVAQVYNANKPKDAPAPTADQVLAAVQSICGTTKCQGAPGTQGDKGDPAPPVTDAQILAQVQAYCSGDGAPCQGKPGTDGHDGADGVSVVRQFFDWLTPSPGGTPECHNYVVLSSHPDQEIDEGRAGDQACPQPPPATEPTP